MPIVKGWNGSLQVQLASVWTLCTFVGEFDFDPKRESAKVPPRINAAALGAEERVAGALSAEGSMTGVLYTTANTVRTALIAALFSGNTIPIRYTDADSTLRVQVTALITGIPIKIAGDGYIDLNFNFEADGVFEIDDTTPFTV